MGWVGPLGDVDPIRVGVYQHRLDVLAVIDIWAGWHCQMIGLWWSPGPSGWLQGSTDVKTAGDRSGCRVYLMFKLVPVVSLRLT